MHSRHALALTGTYALTLCTAFAFGSGHDWPSREPLNSAVCLSTFGAMLQADPPNRTPEVTPESTTGRTTPNPTGSTVHTPSDSYGRADGTWYLTLGGGVAPDFKGSTDLRGMLAASTFLANRLEFLFELSGWHHAQRGRDAVSASFGLTGRYHLLEWNDFERTLFVQLGIGVLVADRGVPTGGTNVNLLPHAGAGITQRLTSDGLRLVVSAGWHHISNANLRGDGRNPTRNGLMIGAALTFPF
jgi:hypothetical protein